MVYYFYLNNLPLENIKALKKSPTIITYLYLKMKNNNKLKHKLREYSFN